MTAASLRLAATALAAALCACSSAPSLPEARCRAAGAAAVLGQPLDDHTQSLALLGSGAVRTEVFPYGAPIRHGDVDPQRLDIEVDAAHVIQRMRCG